jgi:hypothetical protein
MARHAPGRNIWTGTGLAPDSRNAVLIPAVLIPKGATTMTDRHDRPNTGPATGTPLAPDADAEPIIDPIPLPGAAGPLGGSPNGEPLDGVDQPINLPGERPPLSTDGPA